MSEDLRFELRPGANPACARLVFLGVGAVFFGFFFAPQRTWLNLLLDGFYFISLAVSGLFFLATQRLSGALWSARLRRIPEALASALPVGALLMAVLVFGWKWIYPWTHAHAFTTDSPLAGKAAYLREPFVFARMAFTLLLWTLMGWLFRRASLKQDTESGAHYHHRLNQYSAVFLVIFALSFSIGAFDWLMSLEPNWFSTIYAIYVFAGVFVQGLAAITLATVLIREKASSAHFGTEDQLHDLGKLLFAFSTFWAYIWISQYLLIWYGNIPDEATHYVVRTNGPWLYIFAVNFIINWVVPFIVLLPESAKRRPKTLKIISITLLFGHWIDMYVLIMPSASNFPKFGVLEMCIAAGYAGLFLYIFLRSLSRVPLAPLNDPLLQEIDEREQVESAVYGLSGAPQL